MAYKFNPLLPANIQKVNDSGSGDVVGPASATDSDLAQFDGTTGKLLKDGLAVVTTLGSPGADTNIPTEAAVRSAITGAGGGDVSGPASSTDEAVARFDGTTGKAIQDSGVTISDNDEIKNVASIEMDTSYTPSGSEPTGTIFWDDNNKTYSGVLENGVVGQFFEEAFIDGQNDTGSTITDGTPVEYLGSIGNSGNFRITPAIAEADKQTFYFVGILTEDVTNGSVGKITVRGKVRGIQTDGANYGETWSAGDIVYVSGTTAGYLTKTPPNTPIPAIPVALVISAHASNGTLEVRPVFPMRITESIDVNGTPLTTNGQIMVWDNDNGYFDFTENIADYFDTTADTLDDITAGTTNKHFTATDETKLDGIETGAEVNNISDANATDLTDAGDSTLHYHATDRARANHTGTQTAATISDFDTEVSNNTDVAANTSARHAAVTVTDSSEIDFTLTGQDITASIIAGSIDETKLDTSVNASLDLADSATQPGDLATVATTGSYDDLTDKPTIGTGDVVGPSSATDNAVALFDSTTGKLIKEAGLTYSTGTGVLQAIGGDIAVTADSGSVASLVGPGVALTGTNETVVTNDNLKTNAILERTAASGVTIDSVLLKDGNVDGRDVSTDGSNLDSHIANTSNPHSVTAAQVGLGNVTNNAQYYPGGTDVALADGGTGASLTDPNADRIMFWDDSAGAVTWLTPSTGLTISTTNMTVRTSSATQTGIVELATDAETVTGTDTARATTPANITAKMAAPGAIGGTTPSTGKFTTLETTGNIELGAATDTTLSRVSAGVAAIEGQTIATASNTLTLTNKTLTSPVISTISNTGTLTLPTSTGTIALTSDIPTLTETSKSLTVELPTASEDISMFFTSEAVTITKMAAVLTAGDGSESVTWTVRHSTDRSATGNEVVTGGTATTSLTTGSIVTSFNDATIPANSFVWFETTAMANNPASINITVIYDKD